MPGLDHDGTHLRASRRSTPVLAAGAGSRTAGVTAPRMFRNDEGHTFQDVTTAGNFGHLQKGHAVCFGDVDDDGDQDVFEEMGGAVLADKARSMLYANPGSATAWLSLELEGVRFKMGLPAR